MACGARGQDQPCHGLAAVYCELQGRDLAPASTSRGLGGLFLCWWLMVALVSNGRKWGGNGFLPSFIRDLFSWELTFLGNRSGLCIFRDKKLVGLGLGARYLHGMVLKVFPVSG